MSTDRLTWGVIGTGGIAGRFVEDVALLPDAEVVAVGSRTPEAARAFGERFGLAGRHGSYAEHALLAIAAGKPVLVEKPFTMDAVEARTVADAARAAGVFCMEAMWTRFLPHMQRIRELLAAGALGELVGLGADQGQAFPFDPGHRLFAPELGGGALLDLGIYPFSFASMVLGAPETVRALATRTPTGVDATTSAVLTYPGGAHAVLTCSSAASTPRRAWLAGTGGRIQIEGPWYQATSFDFIPVDGVPEHFTTHPEVVQGNAKGMRFQVAEAGRCVRAGLLESPVMPLDETVAIMGTLDEVRDQIGLTYQPL
jgi:predicted dehydrogenase